MEKHILEVVLLTLLTVVGANGSTVPFDHNYQALWGAPHVKVEQNGSEVELILDQYSGGGGFFSKLDYGSGFFHMLIKLPSNQDSHGVLPTYYLTSNTSQHDEVDFEFMGNDTLPFILHTNVISKGVGNREQRIALWFDPRANYHNYSILWNTHQIVLFIDGTPIRIFRNTSEIGVDYPSEPMRVIATIWQADWASGGRPTNWSQSPFTASYKGFDIDGCSISRTEGACASPKLWWNKKKYWQLDARQKMSYEHVRSTYLVYDYCSDKSKHPIPPPECKVNQ